MRFTNVPDEIRQVPPRNRAADSKTICFGELIHLSSYHSRGLIYRTEG